MAKAPKNLPASTQQRLLDQARASGRPFAEVLQYFAMERFLYRLSQSQHADSFVLKGALLLTAWKAPASRPTVDIDLLGRTTNELDEISRMVQEVCRAETEPDGIVFDAESVRVRRIKEDADYEGVRARFLATLSGARITMQIDVGFGDVVYPAPKPVHYPTMLDFPAPVLAAYSPESVVAEKLEAMTKLGPLNSRLKDFFDIWLLADLYEFDGASLAESIRRTFARRGTALESEPFAFTAAFAENTAKQDQWRAFQRRIRDAVAPEALAEVVAGIRAFASPILIALTDNSRPPDRWYPRKGWA